MSQTKRKLAAIMFTDMVGYTALGQKNEALSLASVEEQRKLIRPLLMKHGGREVKTIGDAFLVEFPNAVDAVRCAYDIQRAVREFNLSLPNENRIHLRIGVHLGEVIEDKGDISGDAVNVASRIEPLAEDGGVSISRQVHDHVKGKLDIPLLSQGSKSLKNVVDPVEVYKMLLPWQEEPMDSSTQLDSKRIAVLPFASMSPDPNDEYFADGLTEELIDKLCQVRGLEVIARTSAMNYKGEKKHVSQIGRELRAGALVEGSVRKAGNRIRVTAQLINPNTEGHMWSSHYDKDLGDIFAVQTDIAERVVEALRVQLLPDEKLAIEKKPTSNTEAHILYLKGRYHWNERTPKSIRTAVEYFEKAVEADHSFALAYVGLADSYTILSDQGIMKALDGGKKTRELAEKALQLDPNLAEAHASLGNVLAYVFWDWSRAELEFKRSIELNSAYPTARQWYGKCLSFLGRYNEAVEQHHEALRLDPFSLIININYGEALAEAGRYSEAIQQGMRTVALDPDFAIGHFEFGLFYVGGKEFSKAEIEFKETLRIVPRFSAALGLLGYTYGLAGRGDEGEEMLATLLEKASTEYVDPATIAIAEFGLGKKEEAFAHLEDAYHVRSAWLLYLKAFPAFDSLRTDERFTKILTKMGLNP